MNSIVALIVLSLIVLATCADTKGPTTTTKPAPTPAPTTKAPTQPPSSEKPGSTPAPGPSSHGPGPISSSLKPETTQAATEVISTTVTDSSSFAQLRGVVVAILISALLR